MNLNTLKNNWNDAPEYHKEIHETFVQLVNDTPHPLKEHRDWVEQNVFGFGERSFHWLWKLITDEMPENFSFLEIGVFRCQILSLIKLLRSDAKVFGVTLLDTSGGVWESDYAQDLITIHERFGLEKPFIFKGSSLDPQIIEAASSFLFDVVYVDGIHTFDGALSDLTNYSPLVKHGGYLVIDDCNTEMAMPFGFFQGIKDVYDAKKAWLSTNPPFIFICSVVHISVFQRI